MNPIGPWQKGLLEPLEVMTDLEAQQGQRLYFARMKVEETFRDLKSLSGMGRGMNKRQEMEKMRVLLLLVYATSAS